jgi:SDR family mycofactocin-dependent oxidoreductase
MASFEGRTALVTGAALGQGRSHAVKFATAGANVVICDIAANLPDVPYDMGTEEQLEETKRLVEATGQQCIAVKADVRDGEAMRDLVRHGVERFGSIDVAAINQGVLGTPMPAHEFTDAQWDVVVSVNLTGSWQAAKAVIPQMMENGRGALVFTSSVLGVRGAASASHYAASKHGVIGLMRTLAIELGPCGVRANAVCPTTVPTNMVSLSFEWFSPPGTVNPGLDDVAPTMKQFHLLDVPWVQPEDISEAVLWLASDEARYVTGTVLPVDAGNLSIYGGAKGGMPEGTGFSR